MQESEINTLDKYTQFTMPYPNRIEPDLELSQFPIFTDIEKTNPNKEQLLLRGEESKRLNIIFDNNNTSYEDKNIKDILSNDLKNTGRMDDIYDIDLPDCFMRSAVVKVNSSNNVNNNIKKENIEKFENDENTEKLNKSKEEYKNKKVDENYDDFDIDIDYDKGGSYREGEKDNVEEFNFFGEDDNDNNNNNDDNIYKENDIIENKVNEFKKEKDYAIIDIEEGEIDESTINKNEERREPENESKWQNKDIIDIDEPFNENEKQNLLKEEEKFKKKQIKSLHNKFSMTTLNIIGEQEGENYIGQIIEKGHNYPSNLGIIKIMELDDFSENYFGEKLHFDEISMRENDFEKIIKLIPIGSKKYLFNPETASKADIYKEENDIIILHGKVAQETYYYIMKLTGQINNNSEYTIYKVKNNKNTIRHFLTSVGLYEGVDYGKDFSENVIVSEVINYGINEDPDKEYIIFPGQLFLTKYRKMIKKEKEMQEKYKLLEEKNAYNENFEKYSEEIKNKLDEKIKMKKLEIEAKINNINKLKNDLIRIKKDENIYIKAFNEVEHDTMIMNDKEEEIKNKIMKIKKKLKHRRNAIEELKKLNNTEMQYTQEELYLLENKDELIKKEKIVDEKRKKISEIRSSIFCTKCNNNKRDVIFGQCNHLTLCRECFREIAEEKNRKIKAICPVCNIICKRFYFVEDIE